MAPEGGDGGRVWAGADPTLVEAFFERLHDAALLADAASGVVLDANLEAERLWGRPRSELVGLSQAALHPAADAGRYRQVFAEHVASGRAIGEAAEIVRADGSVRPVRISATTIEAGGRRLVLGVFRDLAREHEALAAQRESEARFAAIFASARDSVFVKDLELRYTMINPAMGELLATPPEEAAGRDDTALFGGAAAARIRATDERVLRGETVEVVDRFEVRGVERVFEVVKTPLRSETGAIVGLCGVARDVTARVRTEAALAESEERYRRLVELSPDGVVVSCDREVVFANRAAVEGAGFASVDEIVGRDLFEFLPASSRPAAAARIEEALASGRPLPFREERVVRRDGSTVEVEVASAPFVHGGQPAVLMVLRDVTRRKIAERRLREREEQYRDLVEHAGVGILTDDAEGRITYANQKLLDLFGYRAEEVANMAIGDLIHPDDRELVVGYHRSRLAGQPAPTTYEFRAVACDGSDRDLEVDVTPLVKEGRRVGSRAYVRDISERRRLERQLARAQRLEAIGRLAGGVAHDLNNMLQAVFTHCDVALIDPGLDGGARSHVSGVREAAERAAALTRQLLAFSRRQLLEPVELDLGELVARLVGMLRRIIGEDVELVYSRPAAAALINADPAQIEQVVLNLAVNARDAMPRGGRLTLEVGEVEIELEQAAARGWQGERRFVSLRVTDTGVGMDASTREQIFDPFFTTKAPGEGTGLGLATVYGIVSQHNGGIEVESAPGGGSVFTVYLPAAGARQRQVVSDETEAPLPGGHETVLVAEDDEAVRGAVSAALEAAGYAVLLAADGREAVALLERVEHQVDLAVLDVVMPGLGGREVWELARTQRPGLRVLFITGYGPEAVRARFAVDEGASLLEKPFSVSELLVRVRAVLDG